jgi:hypothetical protein
MVRQYLSLRMFNLPHEVFMVLMLDSKNRLIEARELLRGTVSQTAAYPHEVVKAALVANAASVILAHNHPSGVAEASRADRMLTDALKSALATVDIAVLDHLIVAGSTTVSFAERGWLQQIRTPGCPALGVRQRRCVFAGGVQRTLAGCRSSAVRRPGRSSSAARDGSTPQNTRTLSAIRKSLTCWSSRAVSSTASRSALYARSLP